MSVAGIIFSNMHDKNIPELTRQRTMASVPFGCRYRLIDFPLSNMVNSGVTNIGVITHYNYHSLMDHIGSGKDWDLARHSGGIRLLPPYITAYANTSNTLYDSRLDALKSIIYTIRQIRDDYVVLSDCDVICNINLTDMVNAHKKSGADMTIAVKKMRLSEAAARRSVILHDDGDGYLSDVLSKPNDFEGEDDVNLNIWVTRREYLQSMVVDAIAHGYDSFTRDVLARNKGNRSIRLYRFNGFFASIGSLEEYLAVNMKLLDHDVRDSVFGVPERPILTKVRNSAPTRYLDGASVSNSMIADGCTIRGRVENSILFRGVEVGRNTTVKNSILFQDAYTGEDVFLNCVVSDKSTVIRDGVMLSGHYTQPYYLEKGKMI